MSFPSFCSPPSEVAVLLDLNLSRLLYLGQVVDLDLLPWSGFDSYSEHAALFLCHIFTQKPMNDRMIEQEMGAALVCNKFLPITPKFSFHMKNK